MPTLRCPGGCVAPHVGMPAVADVTRCGGWCVGAAGCRPGGLGGDGRVAHAPLDLWQDVRPSVGVAGARAFTGSVADGRDGGSLGCYLDGCGGQGGRPRWRPGMRIAGGAARGALGRLVGGRGFGRDGAGGVGLRRRLGGVLRRSRSQATGCLSGTFMVATGISGSRCWELPSSCAFCSAARSRLGGVSRTRRFMNCGHERGRGGGEPSRAFRCARCGMD